MMSILRELQKRGFGAIIASDCHDSRYLDLYFDESADMLEACGFKEKYVLKKDGLCAIGLRD